MVTIIIAGGSGSRLWPLSTPDYPKHLLSITGNESLLQNAYRRAMMISQTVYVVTETSHADLVRGQLPELGDDAFIVEPGRRGTAGCIVAGLNHIRTRHDASEPIAFIHADHVIRDTKGFAYSFKVAGEEAVAKRRITLIGIEPTHPATGFGYIKKGAAHEEGSLIYDVDCFVEKPSHDIAQTYLQSGHYLWNCGYFVGSLNTFVLSLEQFSPLWHTAYQNLTKTTSSKEYQDTYLSFQNDAIDYVLMEKNTELQVVPGSFDWMDVGSYSDMHNAVTSDTQGNHIMGNVETEEVENSFVSNSEEKPVAVIGLDNIVVINTPHGILVARKDLSQKVKEVVSRFDAKKN